MFKFSLRPTSETTEFLRKLMRSSSQFREGIKDILVKNGWRISNRATNVYLTTGPLHVKTNRLRSSVRPGEVEETGSVMSIAVGTNVPYGRFWEEGFTVPEIFAVNKAALRFTVDGDTVFAKHTRAHTQEARPWLYPSFEDTKPEFEYDVTQYVREAMLPR